jgi:hypothetical protein
MVEAGTAATQMKQKKTPNMMKLRDGESIAAN